MLWEVYRIMEFNSQPFDLATPSHRAASRHLKFTVKCGSYSPLGCGRVHVPYFELAAVYEAVMRHRSEWDGAVVRFGVDSSPVVNALNTATSRDPHLMRLLRAISDASIDFRFDVVAVHVTRTHNLLADQGTRHATTQD